MLQCKLNGTLIAALRHVRGGQDLEVVIGVRGYSVSGNHIVRYVIKINIGLYQVTWARRQIERSYFMILSTIV